MEVKGPDGKVWSGRGRPPQWAARAGLVERRRQEKAAAKEQYWKDIHAAAAKQTEENERQWAEVERRQAEAKKQQQQERLRAAAYTSAQREKLYREAVGAGKWIAAQPDPVERRKMLQKTGWSGHGRPPKWAVEAGLAGLLKKEKEQVVAERRAARITARNQRQQVRDAAKEQQRPEGLNWGSGQTARRAEARERLAASRLTDAGRRDKVAADRRMLAAAAARLDDWRERKHDKAVAAADPETDEALEAPVVAPVVAPEPVMETEPLRPNDRRLVVGEKMCALRWPVDDGGAGLCNLPAFVKVQVNCRYLDILRDVPRCSGEMFCDIQRVVEEWDPDRYPRLFRRASRQRMRLDDPRRDKLPKAGVKAVFKQASFKIGQSLGEEPKRLGSRQKYGEARRNLSRVGDKRLAGGYQMKKTLRKAAGER